MVLDLSVVEPYAADVPAESFHSPLSMLERLHIEPRSKKSLYCKHGTYVGDEYGPDYLCGQCESE